MIETKERKSPFIKKAASMDTNNTQRNCNLEHIGLVLFRQNCSCAIKRCAEFFLMRLWTKKDALLMNNIIYGKSNERQPKL